MKKVVLLLGMIAYLSAIIWGLNRSREQYEVDSEHATYVPNQIVVLSDTSGIFHDDFDSVFVFNDCDNYTFKKNHICKQ